MATPIGIMQGRLVPPVGDRIQCFPQERWRDEFALAASAELAAIEWIFDLEDAAMNPLATDEGVAEMRRLSRDHGVAVRSVCADYLMARPLVRVSPTGRAERLAQLDWLVGRCAACGITRMVLPFVDASKIETDANRDDVVLALEHALPAAERAGVEFHLETSLSPDEFRSLLDRVPHPMVRVNYDSGNSASLGYNPREEWAAYGDRVGSVHIKDRVRGGGTVPLGTGDADFQALFASIRGAGYEGPWVLQVARGAPGDEVEWARKNRAFVLPWLESGR
jgi:L-ribulose-5-phosphate 3-epimerase